MSKLEREKRGKGGEVNKNTLERKREERGEGGCDLREKIKLGE